jgi:hypothetical protein
MMTTRRAIFSALAAFLIGVVMLPAFAAAQVQVPNPVPRPKVAPNPKAALPVAPSATSKSSEPVVVVAGDFTHGRVIVLRGLANVFSRGMDKLAKDLKALGVPVTLSNHSRWQTIAAKLIAEYKANPKEVAPVILIGHSLGGDASIVMSNWLAQNGVPVRFVVIFDAVAQTHPIIGGVQEVLNFYKPKGYGQEVKAAASFRGEIRNVDLTDRKDINHTNIDEDPILQAEVTADVVKYLTEAGKPKKSTPVAKAAPPAEPAATPATAAATTPAAAPATTPAAAPGTEPASAEPTATATAPADPASTPAAATLPPDPTPVKTAETPPPPAAEPAPVAESPAVIQAAPEATPAEAPAD